MRIYLDLLPKQQKAEIKRKKIFRILIRQEILFLAPVLLFVTILLNIYYLVHVQSNVAINENVSFSSQEKYQELNKYEEKFKKVNEISALILKIKSGHLNWGKMFETISTITPEGISINGLSTKDYNVFLIGNAKNRDILLEFKGVLLSDSCFENVNVPLSNLVIKENIDFQLDFSIKQDCLKKQ